MGSKRQLGLATGKKDMRINGPQVVALPRAVVGNWLGSHGGVFLTVLALLLLERVFHLK